MRATVLVERCGDLAPACTACVEGAHQAHQSIHVRNSDTLLFTCDGLNPAAIVWFGFASGATSIAGWYEYIDRE